MNDKNNGMSNIRDHLTTLPRFQNSSNYSDDDEHDFNYDSNYNKIKMKFGNRIKTW